MLFRSNALAVRTYTLFYTLKDALGEIYSALHGVVGALIHGPDGAVSIHLARKIGEAGFVLLLLLL